MRTSSCLRRRWRKPPDVGISVGEFTEAVRGMGGEVYLRGQTLKLGYNGKSAHIEPPDLDRVMPIQEVRYYILALGLEKLKVWLDFPDLFGTPSPVSDPE